MKEVETNNPLFYKNFKYLSNDIKYLNATDKRKSSFVQNSPSLEIEVTLINGKKYFISIL
jgi:hypothetical protein